MLTPKRNFLRVIIIVFLTFGYFFGNAQSPTRSGSNIESEYNQARDYYQKGQKSLAYPIFKSLYYSNAFKKSIGISSNTKANIQYYTLETGLSLDDSTVLKDAKDFAEQNTDPAKSQMICYHIGEYYYRKKAFLNAINFYTKGGISNLSKENIANAKFHKGYSYFQLGDYISAGPLLYTVSNNVNDSNYNDANYYYGFVALEDKDYQQSLKCFQTVENVPKYKPMVPYYITEVYYYSGDISKAISYGRAALSSDNKIFNANDLQRLIGHAYFDKSEFDKALSFLKTYADMAPSMSREDRYALSYCYYQNKEYQNSANNFTIVTDSSSRDSIYQNSLFYLASSYLWLGENEKARKAYFDCAQIIENQSQKENAFFNYAKLNYTIGEKDSALTALQQFQKEYPNSLHKQESDDLLLLLLAENKNFKEAYKLTEQMGSPSLPIQQIYPYILYGYSLNLMDEQKYEEAKTILATVTNLAYNEKEKQSAFFNLGKVYYYLKNYDTSVMALTEYLNQPVNKGDVNPENAYFILGYDYLEVKDYEHSLAFFQKVAPKITASSSEIEMDAFRRQGDCYFVTKQYSKAIYIYDNLIKNKYSETDYCYAQKGQIAKFQGKQEEAINNYQLAEKNAGATKPTSDIQYELANTYMSQGNYAKAVPSLQAIVKRSNISDSLYSKAYLSLGVCQYNLNNYNQAQDALERIVLRFPGTEDAKTANEYLKLVYGNLNRPEAFVHANERIGQKISESAKDSLYYETATNFYNNKNWDGATEAFKKYLTNYPNGSKVTDAKYYIGNILFTRKKDSIASMPYYQYVVDNQPNTHLEEALYNLAKINYFKLKDYATALSDFSVLKALTSNLAVKLECIKASIRIQYKLSRWENAYTNANELLTYNDIKTDDKQLANLVIGKNIELANKLDEAMSYYNKVIVLGKTAYASEAQFYVAEIFLKQNKLADAEKSAFGVEKINASDYWTANSYILIGKIYLEKKDYFNAEATLKSIVDNAEDASLKKEAQSILDKVNALQKKDNPTNN